LILRAILAFLDEKINQLDLDAISFGNMSYLVLLFAMRTSF